MSTNTAVALFKHASATEGLSKALVVHENEKTGSRRFGFLPATSKKKDGRSLAEISGLKGQALKRWKRELQEEFKVAMSKEFGGLAADSNFGGRSVTISKSGVYGFFLEPTGMSKEEAAALAEAEERANAAEAKVQTMRERVAKRLKANGLDDKTVELQLTEMGL